VNFTLALLTLAVYGQSSGGSFQITQSVIANGGDASTAGSNLTVVGTAGQVAAGTKTSNSPFSQTGGFWAESSPSTPTAAPASISGQVTTGEGLPLAGVLIRLNEPAQTRTITDSNGNYRFDNVDTENFYIVTPSLANYRFSPSSLSFSLQGNKTDAVSLLLLISRLSIHSTRRSICPAAVPDLLGREPDQPGLIY
jgi:hypothetical protein